LMAPLTLITIILSNAIAFKGQTETNNKVINNLLSIAIKSQIISI